MFLYHPIITMSFFEKHIMWRLPNKKTSKKPLYKQVIELIERFIENGLLTPGERLPSERVLSERLEVNRSTIIHALNDLTDRSVLYRIRGSGTFINNKKWGLQSYPLINWKTTPTILSHQQDAYYLQANQLINNYPADTVLNLANGNLPVDLLPPLPMPKMQWQKLLQYEQDDEFSSLGLKSFREIIKTHLHQHFKMNVDEQQILITSGTKQAIFLIAQALLKPGDAIGIEAPSYLYSLPLFQAIGLRIYAIEMDQQGITLDGLEALINKHSIKMIFLNPIFQNPTGRVMDNTRKKQLLDYCYKQRIPIVEDDAYSGLSFTPQLDTSPIKKFDNHHQVIYMGSLSKYIGTNIRAGWLIAPKSVINKLVLIRQQLGSELSILPQILAEQYLRHYAQTHQPFLQKILASRAEQLIQWLSTQYSDNIRITQPQGGYHLYLTIKQHTQALLSDLLNKKIIVARGVNFGDSNDCIRLSYAHFTPSQNFFNEPSAFSFLDSHRKPT